MSSTILFLSLIQALIVNAGFQDEIVPRAPQATPAGLLACDYVDYALSFCESATPGFLNIDPISEAPCLCYSSTVWYPNVFDEAVYTCAGYAFSEYPSSVYTALLDWEGFCSSVGTVNFGAPATTPAQTTPISATLHLTPASVTTAAASASVDIFTNPGCSWLGVAISYCNSVSPGFTTYDPTSQAPCLCYSSTAWAPNSFDGPVLTCANYVSTAAPQSLSIITPFEGFCSSVGNVLGGAAATTTAGGRSKTGVTVATPTPTIVSEAPTAAATIVKNPNSTTGNESARNWALGLFLVVFSLAVLL